MHRAPLLPLQVPSAARARGGTMLTGAEWTCAVKINAHCRSERKTIPPQLCKAGGGGAPGTQNRSEALPLRKEGHAWPHFSECAFILTTPDPLSFSDRDLPVPSSPPFLCRATPDGFLRVSVRARWPAPSSPRTRNGHLNKISQQFPHWLHSPCRRCACCST